MKEDGTLSKIAKNGSAKMFLSNMPEPVIATAIPWDLVQQSFWPILSGESIIRFPLPFFPLFSE